MVDIAQRLATLSTRPPTPPKDRLGHLIDTPSPNGYFAHISSHLLLDTPNESPSSSAEYFAGSSEKGTKKVLFSPWHEYHKPRGVGGKSLIKEGNLRRLPPSRDCKSLRSILKPSTDICTASPTGELPPFDGSDFPKMIHSTMAHLRSPSRNSRLDAYSALLGSLSAYDDLPDIQSMAETLPEFLGHIRRDISAISGEKGTLDTQLATQSLKLLTIFLCTPVLADALPEDFNAYILDQSISSLEDVELPKIVINHYMQVLAKQNFTNKLMTSERAHRVLLIMKDLPDRVKGNGIIGLRLKIYGRLLVQSKHTLAPSATDWVEHLVSGMLGSTKDIRSLAVAFGIDAGIALGTTSLVSQACFEMFNRKSPDGRTVIDFLAKRLNDMTTSKDDILHVPQIWSVMILLLRNRRHQLERWLHLKPWLLVIQKCLNSSDAHVKSLAMTAWNRLVLAVNIDTTTSLHMIKMLRQPVVSHLNRKGGDKSSKQIRQLAHSSYCNLLYYAFRPSATHAQLDMYWEHYMDKILPESFSASKRDNNQACSILAALFHTEQPRPWDENRANTARFIKPDELPCIDPKWIRSRAQRIMNVFEKLLDLPGWGCHLEEEVFAKVAWQSFTSALGDASKQEVKVSIESMSAVAQILNGLAHFWNRAYVQREGHSSTQSSVLFAKLHTLIQEAVANIGTITFNEPRLLRSPLNHFEAAGTPSSRSTRVQGTLSSPTIHVLRLLMTTIKNAEAPEGYMDILRYLVDTALHSASSRVSQLALLRELTAALIPSESAEHANAGTVLWQIIAEATEVAVKMPRSTGGSTQSPQLAGREFRDAARILEVGIGQPSANSMVLWRRLNSAICDSVRKEVGDGGIVVAIVEPLSAAINNRLIGGQSDFLLSCTASLMQTMAWPHSGHDIDRARKLLWGLPIPNHRPSGLDPLDQFCTMTNRALATTYPSCTELHKGLVSSLLEALANVLGSCQADVQVGISKRIQQGLALWVEDTNGVLVVSAFDNNLGRMTHAARSLWAVVKAAIETMPPSNASLMLLQELVTSSLRSRHRAIVNDAISSWNKTFGTNAQLDYPDALRMTLARLRSVTELELPTFPDAEDVDLTSSPFNFIEIQDTEEGKEKPVTPNLLKVHEIPAGSPKILSTAGKSPRNPSSDGSSCPKSLRRPNKHRVSKTPQNARVRHDGSQIQFAAIEMSSPLNSDMSPSQIVTDHQREIKERQSREVAMFPELGSSPQISSYRADRTLSRLNLSEGKHQQAGVDPDVQISPMFPIIDGTFESFLGSSPTPRSSMKDRAKTTGSSPSLLPLDAEAVGDQAATANAIGDEREARSNKELENETLRQTRILNAQSGWMNSDMVHEPSPTVLPKVSTEDGVASEIAPSDGGFVQDRANVDITFIDASTKAPTQDRPENTVAAQQQVNLPTPISPEFVRNDGGCRSSNHPDERSSAPDILAMNDGTTSGVRDSFQSRGSFYSNDDEQISAQLAADMERASSQAELMGSRKKRKRHVSDRRPESKRAKVAPRAQSCRVVIETQRPQGLGEDCIIVDGRMAIGSPGQPSPTIKRERSSSPTALHLPNIAEKDSQNATPTPKDTAEDALPGGVSSSSHITTFPRAPKERASHSKNVETVRNQSSSRRRSARLNEVPLIASDPQYSGLLGERPSESSRPAPKVTHNLHRGSPKHDGDELLPTTEQQVDNPDSKSKHHQQEIPKEGTRAVSAIQGQASPLYDSSRPSMLQNLGSTPLLPQQGRAATIKPTTGCSGSDQPHIADVDKRYSPIKGQTKPATQDILEGFQKLLGDIKQVSFKAEDERSMVSVLFECVREVQQAGRRHSE